MPTQRLKNMSRKTLIRWHQIKYFVLETSVHTSCRLDVAAAVVMLTLMVEMDFQDKTCLAKDQYYKTILP